MNAPRLIAIDWGTSSLRAYLVGQTGEILAREEGHEGILTVQDGAFARVLAAKVGPWREQHGRLPILMSGMIGSRQGWIEAPYVRCPADVAMLAAAIIAVPGDDLAPLHIVPGLDWHDAAGVPDVIRGEETQVVGALALGRRQSGVYVLPGTHSKWVEVEAGTISRFASFMTGEVFAALKDHTILGRLMSGPGRGARGPGFHMGVTVGAGSAGGPGRLLHDIFSARTLALAGSLAAEDGADYLSGLLIGAELAAAAPRDTPFTIIASGALTERYAEAAHLLGMQAEEAAADCVVAGQLAIARASHLIEE